MTQQFVYFFFLPFLGLDAFEDFFVLLPVFGFLSLNLANGFWLLDFFFDSLDSPWLLLFLDFFFVFFL